jgi:hypothetical protein
MDLGFETIGNATLVAHDGGPVLTTDPWITGGAYFGSWARSHVIPDEQRAAIAACPYVWISHGHPDHLSVESLEQLRNATVLLPNHVGGRIRRDLEELRFRVRVLPDRTWVQLSPRLHVACVADWNQDAILLVSLGDRLIVDLNDAAERGWGPFVRRITRSRRESYLLRLTGSGDADMINVFDEDGRRLPRAVKRPLGPWIARDAEAYGARFFIPFSSMHRYQRADSVWANAYANTLDDYAVGFASRRAELLPAFVRVDFARDEVTRIDPPPEPDRAIDPRELGDDWDEPLERGDVEALAAYLKPVEHVRKAFGFVTFRVGGKETRIDLDGSHRQRGFTFEVPRHSLMTAVRYRVFDDLLIGNFMKVTLHGGAELYPDFTPYVGKYADNGGVRTRAELARYFRTYRDGDRLSYFRDRLDERCYDAARVLRGSLGANSAVLRAAKTAFYGVRRLAP